MRDELQQLPAIGPSMARDLRRLGIRSVKDLARRDPERLYARLSAISGMRHPLRCALHAPRGTSRDILVPAFARAG
jgi:nucleotidyltransferase/DNA polymerase involved in DNA repair